MVTTLSPLHIHPMPFCLGDSEINPAAAAATPGLARHSMIHSYRLTFRPDDGSAPRECLVHGVLDINGDRHLFGVPTDLESTARGVVDKGEIRFGPGLRQKAPSAPVTGMTEFMNAVFGDLASSGLGA
jgi:hypothetical protein